MKRSASRILLDRVRIDIESDFKSGASISFLCRKYDSTAPTMRAVLVEWGIKDPEKDPIKVANIAARKYRPVKKEE